MELRNEHTVIALKMYVSLLSLKRVDLNKVISTSQFKIINEKINKKKKWLQKE